MRQNFHFVRTETVFIIIANQTVDTSHECPDKKLDGRTLEVKKNFCYLGDTMLTKGGAAESVLTRILLCNLGIDYS